jgi:Major tropism determinant N-terminal domain
MSTQLQLRRGNTSQIAAFTGVIGELTVDTQANTLVLQDGVTQGGHYISTQYFANSAYNQANSATALAQIVYNFANTIAGGTAEDNVARTLANSAYTQANTAANTFVGTDGSKSNPSNSSITFSSTNGITVINSGNTITISDPQDLRNTASPTFTSINLSTIVNISSNTLVTSSTSQVAVDSFSTSTYRSAKYLVEMISSTNYHMIELNVVQDGTNTSLSQYGEVILGNSLGTFVTSITGGVLSLLFTPTYSATSVRMVRTALTAS